MWNKYRGVLICVLLLGVLAMGLNNESKSAKCSPETDFTFHELKVLGTVEYPDACLAEKLERTLYTIYAKRNPINNAKLDFDAKLQRQKFKVAHWNIERGFNIEAMKKIFSNPGRYLKEDLNSSLYPVNSPQYKALENEIEELRAADILLLNEVDVGLKRTNYKNIADELASAMNAGYAYAVEFVEVDPSLVEPERNKQGERFSNFHGNAILSKYPIRRAWSIRLPIFYDWFKKEKERITYIEKIRREAAKSTVKEHVFTEVRRGSRVALIVEIELPNRQIINVVSTHLEDRTNPKNREAQMQYILSRLEQIDTPVIMAGDMNSFEFDASPTSITKIGKEKLTDGHFLGKLALNTINPYALATNISSFAVGGVREHRDPTVSSIPVLMPNKVKGFFKTLEKFRFKDRGKFDFSGDKEWSFNGRDGELANSNQRAKKGYVETLRLERSFKIAKYKIDWFFVKPLGKVNDKKYFPAFGRTLSDLNYSYKDFRLSDHSPITVDIII